MVVYVCVCVRACVRACVRVCGTSDACTSCTSTVVVCVETVISSKLMYS